MKNSLFLCLLLAIFFASCEEDTLTNNEPSKDEPTDIGIPEFFTLPLEERVFAYSNMNQLFNTRTIAKGNAVVPLPREDRSYDDFHYTIGGNSSFTIDDFMQRNLITGLLVIKDGCIQLERYGMGNDEQTQWTSFSVANRLHPH